MSYIKYFLFCISVFCSSELFAQSYVFRNFGTAEGLPHSKINCVYQTKDGYIWIGSEGGLSKFDGINFQNFSTSDSLSESNAKALAQDAQGNLWIAHVNGLLSVMSGKTFSKVNLDIKIKPKSIFSVYLDHDGSLWIATLGAGAVRINTAHSGALAAGDFKQYSKKEGLEDNVFAIYRDHLNKLWFVTENGVKYFSEKEETFTLFKHDRMTNYPLTSICEMTNGDMLFSTYQGGIAHWKRDKNDFEFLNLGSGLPSNDISTLTRDQEGNIWIGTWGGGAVKYEGKKLDILTKHEGLAGSKVRVIFEDRENNIWIGTNDDGLSCYKGKKFSLFSKQDGLQNEKINAVIQDRKGLYWIGTQEGISVLELTETGKRKTVKNISLKDKLSNSEVISFALDSRGDVIAGTRGGGAAIISSSTYKTGKTFTSFNANFVYSIVCEKNGTIWFGTVAGITAYNERDKSSPYKNYGKHNGLSGNDITFEFIDKNNNIWVGIRGEGLNCYESSTGKFRTFGTTEGLIHKSPVSMCESSDGQLWIGTEGGGVYRYDGKKFTHLGINEGLNSEYITFVSAGASSVFIGTNKGMSVWNLRDNTIRSFNKADGMSSDESRSNSAFTDKSDNLWFGTGDGLIRYDAHSDNLKYTEPKTYITNYKIFLNDADIGKDTILTHSQFNISFYFTALSYSAPENVKYMFMLEGFEDAWHPASSQNFATYTNMSHGSYKFKVKAAGSNGEWNKIPTTFSFVILPPWWLTTWAYISYAFVLIGGPILYTRWRTAKLKEDKMILEKQVEERTLEIAQKNIKLESANIEILANRDEIAEKNKDITDSIEYAKKIQLAILPRDEEISKILPDSFVLYKPRDIVSGDFYWFGETVHEGETNYLLACADCTGHGVPGAFLTMIGNNILNQIINEHKIFAPAKILFELNNRIKAALKQEGLHGSRDGMDIGICSINTAKKEMIYAAANRPLFYIANGNLETLPADKVAIAGFTPENYEFSQHTLEVENGIPFYIFSDGYSDQFGGPKGKKFMMKKLKELLITIHSKPMPEQKNILDQTIVEWMKNVEQIDDITAVGVRL